MQRDIFRIRETCLQAGHRQFRIRLPNKVTLTAEEKLTQFPNESSTTTRISSVYICLAYGHNYKPKICTIGKMLVFQKDVNNGRFKGVLQLISEQYPTHSLGDRSG